jgi:hypothetical protein
MTTYVGNRPDHIPLTLNEFGAQPTLDEAGLKAMEGLRTLHNQDNGQYWQDRLSAEHPYFPGHSYIIGSLYLTTGYDRMFGHGAWQIRVSDADGQPTMKATVCGVKSTDGWNLSLGRPANGATLRPAQDSVLEDQAASVLAEFATSFAQYQAAIEEIQAVQTQAPSQSRIRGWLGALIR